MSPLTVADDVLDRLVVPSFTSVGPALRRRLFDWDTPRVDGRRIAVTGPTGGIGRATVRHLADLGAEVVLMARNEEKARDLMAELAAAGAPPPSFVHLDLAELGSAREAGRALGRLDRLDALIHNGGALFDRRRVTHDGIEQTLAVHVISPFLVTALALPALTAGREARIVTVSSGGIYGRSLDLDDLQSEHGYKGAVAYARAKRAQVVLTRQWAERLRSRAILAHAMHPGWVDTAGLSGSLPGFSRLLGPLLRDPDQGADTIVWLAGAPADEIGTGRFWLDRRPRPTDYLPGTGTTRADADALWHAVADLAGVDPDIGRIG